MTFNAAGTITIEKCTKSGNNDPASVAPSCVAYATKAVPTIGAIYASSDVIVRGTLKGRVTIVSNSDIAVDNNIDYTNGLTDVLGLIANGSIFVAQYAPNNLTWRAAVIARTGAVKLFDCGGPLKNGTMTVNGSLASFQSPCMATNSPATAGYTNRVYNFDDNLKFLQPPFYPVLEQAYKILRYREVDG